MVRSSISCVLFSFVLFLLSFEIAYSSEYVVVEFFYWDPSLCPSCPNYENEKFLYINKTMNEIQSEDEGRVLVKWVEYASEDRLKKGSLYTDIPPNSIVVNGEFVISSRDFNEIYVREVIDAYLEKTTPPPFPQSSLIAVLAPAFLFGFFETFTPCLIVLLSFILSYTIAGTTQFREGVLHVMCFGAGFVFAACLLGLTVGLIFLSLAGVYTLLMLIICIFAIFYGLYLIGLNRLGFLNIKFKTNSLVKKLSKRYMSTHRGLFLLGFIFYFLDPCIAPIFFSMLPFLHSEHLPLILMVFCLGVTIPFIGVGIFAGSISKFARSAYIYKSKIRGVSGLILIAYSLYLLFSINFKFF